MATEMKRTTVSLTDEIVDRIALLKESGAYPNCSYSEIIRRLIVAGLPAKKRSK